MKYRMNVVITKDGNEKVYNLNCIFFYDEEDYGNGYYLNIHGDNFYEKYFDIRYDKTFRSNEKEKYLVGWAYNYWSGENGAWSIKSLEIIKSED